MLKLSIIMPTKGRGSQVARLCKQMWKTTLGFNVELIVLAHPEEETRKAFGSLSKSVMEIVDIEYMDVRAIDAYQIGAGKATGTHLLGNEDESWPQEGWLANDMKKFDEITDGHGYVKLTSDSKDYWAERAIGNRRYFWEVLGGVICVPHYITVYDDVEKSDRAIAAGLFFEAEGAFVEHRTHVYGKAEIDKTYQEGGLTHWPVDRQTFLQRKGAGYPIDYKPALAF